MIDKDGTAGRIALVTGANKGIGREVVAQLARRGMTVLLAARDEQRRADAVAALRADGLDVHPVALDVTDVTSVAEAARWVDDEYGRLDVLVNNAAITGGRPGQPSVMDLDRLRSVFETNVFGVLTVTNAMLPLLRRSGAAVVVNVSSSVGSLQRAASGEWDVMPPSATYVPSKTALNSLTVQYAKELQADKILVNAVNPGWCATDLNGHQGQLSAAEGANIVVRYATIGPDGPTGGFFGAEGVEPW
ncbi:SDR family NAD(P)-dependent oxidoreductase [Plantactinospora endophytica]|uniref:Dehydrogenase n=1 Tax=Plantactinospora endophytica TaxID=673535 RepID=A0ABQ4E218_9ACTN|nr:SDR family NAD(P)-dependent oxidoreductase [Plantactinospora endophytica]GIG88760.1 dehydrogenase [Plantactinospora endophytica]